MITIGNTGNIVVNYKKGNYTEFTFIEESVVKIPAHRELR